MDYSENFDLENAIEETKYYLEKQYDSIDSFKNHARDIFTSISLIAVIWGILQIGALNITTEKSIIHNCLVIIAGVLYCGIIFLNARLLNKTDIYSPMKIEWKTFEKLYFNKNPKKILENKLDNYLQAVELNRPILFSLRKRSTILNVFYLFMVASLILSIFIK